MTEYESKIAALVDFAAIGWKVRVLEPDFWPRFARCIATLCHHAPDEAKDIMARCTAVYEGKIGAIAGGYEPAPLPQQKLPIVRP